MPTKPNILRIPHPPHTHTRARAQPRHTDDRCNAARGVADLGRDLKEERLVDAPGSAATHGEGDFCGGGAAQPAGSAGVRKESDTATAIGPPFAVNRSRIDLFFMHKTNEETKCTYTGINEVGCAKKWQPPSQIGM